MVNSTLAAVKMTTIRPSAKSRWLMGRVLYAVGPVPTPSALGGDTIETSAACTHGRIRSRGCGISPSIAAGPTDAMRWADRTSSEEDK